MRRSSHSTSWLPWGLGLAGIGALLLLTKKSSAGGAADAPAGKTRTATVLQDVRTRVAPDVNSAAIAPDRVPPNNALAGSTVQVIRTGLTGPGAAEWWEIVTPGGGRGFAAAKNTSGTLNMKIG